jgi:hypothetical protein
VFFEVWLKFFLVFSHFFSPFSSKTAFGAVSVDKCAGFLYNEGNILGKEGWYVDPRANGKRII